MAIGRIDSARARTAPRRGGRRALVVVAVLLLLAAFLVVRFPWERLLPPLLALARSATGADVRAEALGVGLGSGGPELSASGVWLAWPGSEPLAFDAVAVRPAWALAWLRAHPRWHVAASGPSGGFRGELGSDRVAGELREVDVAALPWTLLGSPPPLRGRVSGTLDLTRRVANGAWHGTATFAGGTPGSVELAGLPVAIPYEQLEARLAFAADGVELPEARLEGPLVTASFVGRADAAGGALASWPIALDVLIERMDPNLRSYLGPLGISLDPQGRARVHVSGTLSAPFLSGGRPGSG